MRTRNALHWRPGRYLKSSGALFFWLSLRALSQVLLVLLLARGLGAESYGRYVAVVAVASFVTPFAGLGLSNLVLRNGAMDPAHLHAYLSRALRAWLPSTLACVVAAWLLARLLLPGALPWLAVGAALAAEVIAASLTDLAGRYLQAQHRMHGYGATGAGLIAARLAAMVLVALVASRFDVVLAFWAHAASGLLYAAWLLQRLPKIGPVDGGTEPMDAATGLPFSLAQVSMRLQAEFNKPVLARLDFSLAGNYNAAQRAIDLAALPLSALQEALWPRLYAHAEPARQLRRTGLFLLLAAALCSAALWLAAPCLPFFLGEDFRYAVPALRWLAWLPLLQVLRNLANFHVIHENRLRLLGWAYAVGALVNVASVAILVPQFGIPAAIAAAYATELSMLAVLASGAIRPLRR